MTAFLLPMRLSSTKSTSAAVAETIKRLQLVKYLGIGLGAGNPTVKFDDIAELAGEWAAARELHADVKIMLEL